MATAADVIKANNTTALNLGASWTSGTAPTASDVAVWNSTVTAANTVGLGGNASWQGIKMQAPGGKVTITGGTANTLTLGSEGIQLLTGTQQFEIQTAASLLTSQTWTLSTAPSATQSLVFNAQSQGSPFTMNGNTLNVLGTGTVRFTSGSLLTGGTINVGNTMFDVQSGASRTSFIGSDVTINVASGKFLRFGINTAPGTGLAVSSSAAIVLNSGTMLIETSGAAGTNRLVQSGLVTMNNGAGVSITTNLGYGYLTQFTGGIAVSGSTNWLESNSGTANTTFSGPLTGSGTLNVQNTSTGRLVEWSGNNAAFAGTVALNGASGNRNLRLTSGSAGSSLGTWSIASGNALEINGVSVSLGTLAGAGTLTNSHATAAGLASVGSGTFTGLVTNGTGSGGMGLTKVGSGVLSLQGANTYTGPTNVSAGTLAVTSAYAGTSGSFSGVTVADGATLSVTQAGPAASYRASNLVLGGATGGALQLSLASGATVAPITTGGLTLAGTSTVRLNVTPVAGMKLIAHSSPLVGDLSQLQLVGLPFRVNATLVDDGGSSINVGVVQNNVPKWTGAINAAWNIDATENWVETDSAQATRYLQSSSGTDAVVFDDSATGSTAITLNEAVLPVGVTFNNATKDYAISGAGSIGGSGGIVKSGAAALTLATANTFAGGVALNDGRLNLGNAGAVGNSKLTIAGGSLDNTSGGALTTTSAIAQDWNADFTFVGTNALSLNGGAVTLNADRTVTVSAGELAVGGVAGAGRALTKAGAGTLQIGASTYTGTTTVTGGTLKAASATSFLFTAGVTLANTAGVALDLNGFNQTITNLSGGGATGGTVMLGGATLTTGAAADATIGSLSGTGGLVKTGAGRLSILNGAAFTGTTSIAGGTLDVGPLAGVFGSGTISMSGANFIQASGTLTNPVVGSQAGISARGGDLVVNVGGAGAIVNLNSGGTAGLGQMLFNSATADSRVVVQNQIGVNNNGGWRPMTVNAGVGTASVELAGVISPGTAGGTSGLEKFGSGRLILSAANTYIGLTRAMNGVIQITNPLALQFSWIDTSGTGTYDVTGITTPTIGGLTGSTSLASVVTAGYGSLTSLTINRPSGSVSYGGVITDGAAGMSLTKLGAGTQVFSGANTYSGATTLNGGTLQLQNQLALQNSTLTLSGSGNVVFDAIVAGNAFTLGGLATSNTAASLALQNSATTAVALSVGGNNATTTFAGRLTGAGSLLKVGTGALVLSGSSTYAGPTSVNAGSLVVDGSLLSAVALSGSASALGGSGSVGAISGVGLVGPGNSPGILTATSLDPTGGLSFAFEFTQATPNYGSEAASDNDVLWLTGATPFTSSLTAANTVSIYLTPAAAAIGTLTGGFFTTNVSDFAANIADGSFQYFVQDAQGTFSYNGENYVTLAEYDPVMSVTISTVSQNGGQVMQMVVVPEPGTLGLLGLAGAVAGVARWRRRRATEEETTVG